MSRTKGFRNHLPQNTLARPRCIDVPGNINACDKKEVEETRTFTMNPKERPYFCPFLKLVALSEP